MSKAYHGGVSLTEAGGQRLGPSAIRPIVPADVLDAWFDPAPAVLAALRDELALQCRVSPPAYADGLREKLAQSRGLDTSSILIGAGSSALLFSTLPRLCAGGVERALCLSPSYSEYPHMFGKVLGAKLDFLHLSEETGLSLRHEDMSNALSQQSYDTVSIVNPNNPTGLLTPAEMLHALAREFANTVFLIDEAYIDFADGAISCERLASTSPNVVVLKSMSKAFALSGLRIGYMVGRPDTIERLSEFIPPWAVSWPGQLGAMAAIDSSEYYHCKYAETRSLRLNLADDVKRLPYIERVFASETNFLLLKICEGIKATRIIGELAQHGVFVRGCTEVFRDTSERFIRIAVRSKEENVRIVETMKQLDLAGVADSEHLAEPRSRSMALMAPDRIGCVDFH